MSLSDCYRKKNENEWKREKEGPSFEPTLYRHTKHVRHEAEVVSDIIRGQKRNYASSSVKSITVEQTAISDFRSLGLTKYSAVPP